MSTPQTYHGNGNHDWEHVAYDLQRIRVPGGWLYSDVANTSRVFVPMPEVVKHKV